MIRSTLAHADLGSLADNFRNIQAFVEEPVVGSICLNTITSGVAGLTVEPGGDVVLIGRRGEDEIPVGGMADRLGTMPYELPCRVGTRIERVYNHERP